MEGWEALHVRQIVRRRKSGAISIVWVETKISTQLEKHKNYL